MLHCAKTATPSKPVQPSMKQENGASPLSTANSRLLASNLPGSGDGASTERPAMELPAGKYGNTDKSSRRRQALRAEARVTWVRAKLRNIVSQPSRQIKKYYACDVTLSVYPHRAGLKNMPGHGGNRTYDLWNTSPMLCQLSYAVRSVRACDISELSPSISV